MPSFGILRRVTLVRTDVSEEHIIVLRLLVTANAVIISSNLVTLLMEALHSFETSVFIRSTRRNILEDGIHTQIQTV
jgi:hypothetical protein